MPVPIAVKAGIIAVSVAVAAAVAIYESPELRRYAEDIRRRIAIALHSLGDGISPADREPMFNRPEDVDGFLMSRSGPGAEPGVDADEETRRRQREELMYWNRLHLEKKEKERKEAEEAEKRFSTSHRGSSFDDILRQYGNAEQGTDVFNTGADTHASNEGLVRRRGLEGLRGLNSSVYLNPFADEHEIAQEEIPTIATPSLAPGQDEVMSDIYTATTREAVDEQSHTLSPEPALVDVHDHSSHTESAPLLERELAPNEFMTAGQQNSQEAYASIQAWAQGSHPDFYSPLPMSPSAPMSEPELISDGALTPTDSMSIAGSGVDVGNDSTSRDGDHSRALDILSESDGMATPASWSEVGSVISENDGPMHT